MTTANIRLACQSCDRDDKDFITPDQLAQCKAEGWADINEVGSFEEAIRRDEQRVDQSDGCVVLACFTQLGICPECQEDD